MRREAILSPDVPPPIMGSHAVRAGDYVFLGGQIPSDYLNGLAPEAKKKRETSVPAAASKHQSHYILENAQKILKAAGSSLELGVRIDQFCTHPDAASPYLEVRNRTINPEIRPCSTHVHIDSLLVPGALCGLWMMALTGEAGKSREMDTDFEADPGDSSGQGVKPSPLLHLGGPAGSARGQPTWMKAGDFVWVTGQVATDFQTGVAAEARTNPDFWYGSPIKLQADFTLRQLGKILEGAGTSLGRVVRADVYLTDMNDVYELEEVWQKHFPENPPARTTIPMNRLAPKDCIIEINVIALRGERRIEKETITAPDVPAPDIHQPHAVRAGEFLFISGMCATDFGEGLAPAARLHPEMPWFGSSAKKQTGYILENMEKVCRSAGTDLKNVVWTQNFYTNPAEFQPSLEVWQERFPKNPPAAFAGVVRPPHLIPECTILMDAVAVLAG